MNGIKKVAAYGMGYLTLGALVVSGMRAAEWLIPQPESRVIFCLASDVSPVCKTLAEWLEQSAKSVK